ncbi:MAG: hypothetical protein ACREOJ_15575 [Gemmatimonadaceae bacterium]
MATQFDSSSIPDDGNYWDGLTERVVRAMRAPRTTLGWLGGARSAWLVAACMVLALAVSVVAARDRARAQGGAMQVALMPADRLGQMLVTADAPPPVAALAEVRAALRSTRP